MQTKLRLAKLFAPSVLLLHPIPVATQPATTNLSAKPITAKRVLQARLYGLASWYGEERQGDAMANGQKFDRFKPRQPRGRCHWERRSEWSMPRTENRWW